MRKLDFILFIYESTKYNILIGFVFENFYFIFIFIMVSSEKNMCKNKKKKK